MFSGWNVNEIAA